MLVIIVIYDLTSFRNENNLLAKHPNESLMFCHLDTILI